MFRFSGSVTLNLAGNTESCPVCGRPSAMMEGTFTFRDGLIEVLSAPQWTRDMLDRAQGAVQQAAEAAARDDSSAVLAAIAELRNEQQALADLVEASVKGRPKNRVVQVLAGVAIALGLVSDVGGAASAIEDAVDVSRDTITSIMQALDQNGEPTGEPSPSPRPQQE